MSILGKVFSFHQVGRPKKPIPALECGQPFFIEFQCPSEINGRPGSICHHNLGGPDKNTLGAHDFTKAPYKDVRYCRNHGFVLITINNLSDIPTYKILGKVNAKAFLETVTFRKLEKLFKFSKVIPS